MFSWDLEGGLDNLFETLRHALITRAGHWLTRSVAIMMLSNMKSVYWIVAVYCRCLSSPLISTPRTHSVGFHVLKYGVFIGRT